MKIKSLILFISIGLLTGCMPNQSVEEIGIIQIAGYDLAKDGKIGGTVSIPQYGRSDEKTAATELYLSVTADSVKDVEKEVQKQSSKPISIGKLVVTLYSEELAKDDISDIIDVLSRDPQLSRNMYLGIVKGETRTIIEQESNQGETTAKYFNRLMKNNMHHNFPHSSLHDFLYAYYAKGMDGFLPYIAQGRKFAEIEGVALFDGGKLAAVIPASEAFIFKMMKENFDQGMQELDFKGGVVVMESIGSKFRYDIKGTVEEPGFVIDIKIKGVVNELVGIPDKANESLAKEIEVAFAKHFEEKADAMIQLFQEEEVDPLGLGHFLRTQKRGFNEEQWLESYSDIPIQVKVAVDITEYGTFS